MHIFGKLNVDYTEDDIKFLLKNYTYYDFVIDDQEAKTRVNFKIDDKKEASHCYQCYSEFIRNITKGGPRLNIYLSMTEAQFEIYGDLAAAEY